MLETKLQESVTTINGVSGRMFGRVASPDGKRYLNQRWISESRPVKGYGPGRLIKCEIRFDDECRNGHMSFAVTFSIYKPGARDIDAGGCLHDEIAQYFPELAPLIKWHLPSTDGPMHYIANTTYHASDRDHHGLLKGESRQIRNGRTGQLCWILATCDLNGNEIEKPAHYVDSDVRPVAGVTLVYLPRCRVGEGKARDLDAARSCAAWPEATDEQLTLPRDELAALLAARLPALLEAFKADVLAAGFEWGV